MVDQAHGKKKENQEILEKIFHLFDKDNDGCITTEELTTVLESFNPNLTKNELKKQVDKAMADGDKDRNGTIDFAEFLVFMSARMSHHEGTLKELRDAFRVFDCDHNGFIDAGELKRVMSNLGTELSDKEVETMIKNADLDGNGKIDFEEFVIFQMMAAK